MANSDKHPCFNVEAKGKYGRVHLPIAPKCNIQCNYCNRDFDCVNETRPGVTSSVLKPHQAVAYLKELKGKYPNLSVAGIAGPGDPFANAEETMETLRQLKVELPDMIACLSSNGLNVLPYVEELAELGVGHVTITVNAVDPDITKEVYGWVRDGKWIHRRREAAEVLLEKQIATIKALKAHGVTVKINTIVMPGINAHHIPEIAEKMAELGADTMNLIPLYPVEGTPFADMEEPPKELIKELRKYIGHYIKPMEHCARCRADAAGLLGKDIKESTQMIREFAMKPNVSKKERKYVAVASHEGLLVNQHLGEAKQLYIFSETPSGYRMVEQRKTPPKGGGDKRWEDLAETLSDCRAILVGGAGSSPYNYISKSGVEVIEMTGLIDEGLDSVYKGKVLRTMKKRDAFKCGSECTGTGGGCG